MKFSIALIFAIFTQIMIIIMSYEFIFFFARSNGGIGCSNAIQAVNPIIWIIVALEVIVAAIYLNAEWEKTRNHK